VTLAADREREQVRITVADDGRGMDIDRIWDTAVKRGLVDPSAHESMNDAEIFLLTCQAGFSTKEEATKVSGRGVGMDVVKGKIEYLGGTISLHTVPGEGTRVTLLLPLTLAIIQALLVGADEQIFALPLAAVDEVLDPDEVGVKTVDGAPVVVLRDGTVVSLQRLDHACGFGPADGAMPDAGDHIVLLHVADEVRALAVPRLVGRQEIVIKPLSPLFKGTRGIGGATVLGDGRVALILDPRALVSPEV
jgi:two-component system chemotaxis sensor kinase CheA